MMLIRQPTPSSCSQACLAMLAGCTLRRVFRLLPDSVHGCRACDIITAGERLGLAIARPSPIARSKGQWLATGNYFLKIAPVGSLRGHLMVLAVHDDKRPMIYDPNNGVFQFNAFRKEILESGWRLVSLMRVR